MGRVIRAHRKAARKGPAVGTSLPVRSIPVGSVVCNVEHRIGGRGVFATASGDHAVVISHSRDNDTTRIKLSSGGEKTVEGGCRATVGGGRRTKKPMLKVRNSNKGKKRKSRRKAMNPVEHSHGDGNNQQIVGHVSTVLRRDAPRGRNLSLIADRRRRNSVEHTRGVGNNNHYIGHVSTVRRDAPPGRTLGLIVPSRSVIIRLGGQAVNPVDHPPGIRPALIVPRITPTLRGQAAAIAAAA